VSLWQRGPGPRVASAASAALEDAAVAAYLQPGGDDPRVVRRFIAGEPVTLLVDEAPGRAPSAKTIRYRTVDDLRVASWIRDDRRYVLVSRLAGDTACTICHAAPAGTVL
jgi:hypothetical protein